MQLDEGKKDYMTSGAHPKCLCNQVVVHGTRARSEKDHKGTQTMASCIGVGGKRYEFFFL